MSGWRISEKLESSRHRDKMKTEIQQIQSAIESGRVACYCPGGQENGRPSISKDHLKICVWKQYKDRLHVLEHAPVEIDEEKK